MGGIKAIFSTDPGIKQSYFLDHEICHINQLILDFFFQLIFLMKRKLHASQMPSSLKFIEFYFYSLPKIPNRVWSLVGNNTILQNLTSSGRLKSDF